MYILDNAEKEKIRMQIRINFRTSKTVQSCICMLNKLQIKRQIQSAVQKDKFVFKITFLVLLTENNFSRYFIQTNIKH